MNKASLLLVLYMALPASAQSVLNADTITVQPTISRDAKGFNSCGVRVVAGVMSQSADSEIYDFSLAVWDDTMVLFKAGAHVIPFDQKNGWDIKKRKLRLPGPDAFWVAKRDDAVSTAPIKYMKSDTPGFTMGVPESNAGISAIWAIAYGKPMQIALRYGVKSRERVVAFEAKMDPRDLEAFEACTAGLLKRMEAGQPTTK